MPRRRRRQWPWSPPSTSSSRTASGPSRQPGAWRQGQRQGQRQAQGQGQRQGSGRGSDRGSGRRRGGARGGVGLYLPGSCLVFSTEVFVPSHRNRLGTTVNERTHLPAVRKTEFGTHWVWPVRAAASPLALLLPAVVAAESGPRSRGLRAALGGSAHTAATTGKQFSP
jgi:hypothetical protein